MVRGRIHRGLRVSLALCKTYATRKGRRNHGMNAVELDYINVLRQTVTEFVKGESEDQWKLAFRTPGWFLAL